MLNVNLLAENTTNAVGARFRGVARETRYPAIKRVAGYFAAEEHRAVLRRVLWVMCVLALLVVSATAIFGLHWLFGSYKPGIAVSIVLLAMLLGITALFVLPPKTIVAVFGGFVGVALSEIGNAAGLISVLRKQVTALALELGAIARPAGEVPEYADPFISGMVWTFILIVGLLCLPAFSE